MKHFLSVLALGLSTLTISAQAQQANIVGPGINAPMYELQAPSDAVWPKELLGTWEGAEDLAKGVPSGTISITADKKVSIEPAGMYTLQGYWFAKPGKKLLFDTPVDKSEATYALTDKGNTLSLTFANGVTQKLVRASALRSAVRPK